MTYTFSHSMGYRFALFLTTPPKEQVVRPLLISFTDTIQDKIQRLTGWYLKMITTPFGFYVIASMINNGNYTGFIVSRNINRSSRVRPWSCDLHKSILRKNCSAKVLFLRDFVVIMKSNANYINRVLRIWTYCSFTMQFLNKLCDQFYTFFTFTIIAVIKSIINYWIEPDICYL